MELDPQLSPPPPPRQRWYLQFSLRTLFILLAVRALLIGHD
jgi:hypothetical protein